MVINLAFFSRPYGLIKGPTFINFWNFFQALRLIQFAHFVQSDFFFNIGISLQCDFFSHTSLHIICQIFPALRIFFFPNFPCPTFIQGPTFILFAKSSRLYAYSLPYVYNRLQSMQLTQGLVNQRFFRKISTLDPICLTLLLICKVQTFFMIRCNC